MSKLRSNGVELPIRQLRDGLAHRGDLLILDSADQGLRRLATVAQLMQNEVIRHELVDVHVVWLSEARFTPSGFERQRNDQGQAVDFAQSRLCTLDMDPIPELVLSKLWNVRPKG